MTINTIGWIGVICILSGYAIVSFEVVEPDSLAYIGLNIIGAMGIITSSYHKHDFQPVFLNIVWLLIAIVGLLRLIIS